MTVSRVSNDTGISETISWRVVNQVKNTKVLHDAHARFTSSEVVSYEPVDLTSELGVESPLAKLLLGRKVGDIIPKGRHIYTIERIDENNQKLPDHVRKQIDDDKRIKNARYKIISLSERIIAKYFSDRSNLGEDITSEMRMFRPRINEDIVAMLKVLVSRIYSVDPRIIVAEIDALTACYTDDREDTVKMVQHIVRMLSCAQVLYVQENLDALVESSFKSALIKYELSQVVADGAE